MCQINISSESDTFIIFYNIVLQSRKQIVNFKIGAALLFARATMPIAVFCPRIANLPAQQSEPLRFA